MFSIENPTYFANTISYHEIAGRKKQRKQSYPIIYSTIHSDEGSDTLATVRDWQQELVLIGPGENSRQRRDSLPEVQFCLMIIFPGIVIAIRRRII